MAKTQITRYYLSQEADFSGDPVVPVYDVNHLLIARISPECYASFALEGSGKLRSGQVLNVSGEYIGCDTKTKLILLDVCKRKYTSNFKKGKYNVVGLNADASKYLAFKKVNAQWGLGVKNTPLVPFLSVAADPKLYPYGTKLYIKELVGLLLPNNTKHDGRVIVHDIGGNIKGAHLDLFTGTRGWHLQLKLPEYCEVEIIK